MTRRSGSSPRPNTTWPVSRILWNTIAGWWSSFRHPRLAQQARAPQILKANRPSARFPMTRLQMLRQGANPARSQSTAMAAPRWLATVLLYSLRIDEHGGQARASLRAAGGRRRCRIPSHVAAGARAARRFMRGGMWRRSGRNSPHALRRPGFARHAHAEVVRARYATTGQGVAGDAAVHHHYGQLHR